ncbi:MAG: alpha-N-arabinofuranosidase, partial [Blastocatellia bacterium]|nr:alpha-N-arabinofuranosidase [Blastocatellia bacterium]
VPYLDVSAGYDQNTLVLNVVNRHLEQAIETEFEAQDSQFAGPVEIAEVNGPDIKAENDFGSTKVQATARAGNAEGNKLRYRFPPHSYTMLKAKLVTKA